MGDYHIFPQARSSEIARYNSRPLPLLPTIPSNHPSQVYLSKQNSASYESIIDHRIPSPFLCNQEEIQQIWSRASQHSILSEATPSLPAGLKRSDSLGTTAEFTGSKKQRSSAQAQTLLPPALEYQYGHQTVDVVPCRLSSASTEDLSFSLSPVAAKRSATPDLLHKLSTDLEGFGLAEGLAQSDCESAISTTPTTPDESFSSSIIGRSPVVYRSVNYSSTSSTTTLDMGELSPQSSPKPTSRRSKPANVFTATTQGHRNISSPMPSPRCIQADPPFFRTNTSGSAVDPTHRPLCPTPSVPSTPVEMPVVEVSRFDWDDDDLSKLARVKKSIGDLRAAAIRTPKTSSRERKTEKVVTASDKPCSSPRPRAQRSMTAPTQPMIRAHQQQAQSARPSVAHAVSANRIRASLPPLPTRTSSTSALPSQNTVSVDKGIPCVYPQQQQAQNISRKTSVRIPAVATPVRQRAASDAPITQTHSLFPPSTPASSPSDKSSRQFSPVSISGTSTPSVSPRSTTTAATTISNTTTAVNGRSRQSSIATTSLNDKPLPTPYPVSAPTTHRRRGGVRAATGNKRFSMLSFVSVRSSHNQPGTTASSRGKRAASSSPRVRVVGLGKFRRWWRWVSRCSVPAVSASATAAAAAATTSFSASANGKQTKKAAGKKCSQQIVRVASPQQH